MASRVANSFKAASFNEPATISPCALNKSIQSAGLINTGRLYGDEVDVSASQISNGGSGVIAARSSLNLAGASISNNGANALLLSLGDMSLTGTGNTSSVTNSAGRIEASGDLTISANTISNANGGVQTAIVTGSSGALTTYVVPNGSATQYPLSQCRGISESWDQALCIVHPEVYGQRSDLAAAWDSTTTGDADTGFVTTTTTHYAWNASVYSVLNVATMSAAAPAEPGGSGACTSTDFNGNAVPVNSIACNRWRTDAAAWDSAYAQVSNNLQTAITAYNASVDADNATVNFEDYTVLRVSSTTQQTQVTASTPGQILAGGTILLSGTTITNTDSRIVAGGLLYVNGLSGSSGAGSVNNVATQGQQVVSYSGTSVFTHLDSCGLFGSSHCRNTDATQPYAPAPTTSSFDLPTVVYQQNASQTQGGTAQANASAASSSTAAGAGSVGMSTIGAVIKPGAAQDQAIATSAVNAANSAVQAGVSATAATVTGAGAVGAASSAATTPTTSQATLAALASASGTGATAIIAPAQTVTSIPTVQRFAVTGSDQKARDVILTVLPRLTLSSNQLFKIHPEPGAKYLVETDPAFTNYRSFIGSDYFEAQLNLDPSHLAKRYGDGFEEQSLVNDQILALTGRRFLSGYASTEDEYRSLMDAGVAFAKAYQLSPGVTLSAAQMALLTTDMVWLSTQTVTLADGSKTQVLVPQVYLRQAQGGDLAPSGALMSGSTVVIRTPGQLVNSGSLQGDALSASAADITNSGHIAANNQLVLLASNDMSNLGGSIVSSNGTVSLTAERDIVLQTRTLESSLSTSNGNGTSISSRTHVDRIATVQAGADLLISAGRDLSVQGASLSAGNDLSATAGRDLIVSAVQGSYQIGMQAVGGKVTQGRTGYISQVSTTNQLSTITAGHNLGLVATGDATLTGSNVSAGNNALIQGANVSIAAARDSQSADIQTVQKRAYDRGAASTQTLVGGTISAANNLTLYANGTALDKGNLTLAGASVTAANGQASLIAANDVKIGALTTESSTLNQGYYQHSGGIANVYTSSEQRQGEHTSQTSKVEGSSVNGNTVYVQAGDKAKQTGDITLSASSITAQGAAVLDAGRDVLVTSADQSGSKSDFDQSTKSFAIGPKILEQATQQVTKDLLRLDPVANKYLPPPSSSGTGSQADQARQSVSTSIGSSISADSLSIDSGRDTLIRGSAIVTTGDLGIKAGRNLDILTSQDQQSGTQRHDERNDGLFNSGAGLTTGSRQVNQSETNNGSNATSSQLASLSGNVALKAGEAYQQTGSQVLALGQGTGGDISINAKTVNIDAARNTSTSSETTNFKQEGVTVSLSVPLINALQSLQQTADAGSKSKDSRMQALAAATAAMTVASTVSDIAQNGLSAGVSVDLGHSQNQSKTQQASDLAAGSSVSAARDLTITASGASKDSSINVTGSDLGAGRNAIIRADGVIALQAASNTETLRSSNSSQSASVGVTFGGGSQNGLSIHAAASAARGNATGDDQRYTDSHLAAGNTLTLQSGGDTTLKGATAQADTIRADIGGNLSIQSLQDSSKYDAKQQSASVGVSLCIPPICYGASTASASGSNAKASGDFSSVTEQSGVKAGNGGFAVSVRGGTDLKGGVVSSSQAAVEAGKNSLSTATLTTSDLSNDASASALAAGATVSSDMLEQGKYGVAKAVAGAVLTQGNASGSSSGATRSAVSAGTINITDSAAQKQLTGQDDAATVSSLNRDTGNAQVAAERQDVKELQQKAADQHQISQAVFNEATKFTDDAYKKMFLEKVEVYKLKRDQDGNVIRDINTNLPLFEKLTDAEKQNLSAGPDGKVHIANNGIFNDAEASAKYASQHGTSGAGEQYFVYAPVASNKVSELMIAGYQKFLEGDTLGLTNATQQNVDAIKQYGQDGLQLDGHSRGSLTVLNALQSVAAEPNAKGSASGTTVNFYGPAANVQNTDAVLGTLQGRSTMTPEQQQAATLHYECHVGDPVCSSLFVGNNAPTGGTIPEGSSAIKEEARAATGQKNTTHNCYGADASKASECARFWNNTPDGLPTLAPVKSKVPVSSATPVMAPLPKP